MNYWKGSKRGVLVWVASFLVGGLILYKVGQSSFPLITHDRALKITSQTTQAQAQAMSSRAIQDAGDSGAAPPLVETETREQTTKEVKASVPKGSVKDQEILEEQKLAHKQAALSKIPLNIKDFPSPVQGNILRSVGNYYSEAFENYLFHAGMDYAVPEGTVIRATHGGQVVFIGQDPILGQKVILDCGQGWLVTYGGLDNLRVQDGAIVVTREALGQVGIFPGAEGKSNQPQLHYEVWHGNEVQKPL